MADYDDNDEEAFSDITRPHPWSIIVDKLIQHLDGCKILFDQIKNLSKPQIGAANFSRIHDARSFFDSVENNLEENDMLTFLINVTDHIEMHVEFGTETVSENIRNYKWRLQEFQKKQHRAGIYNDKDFVGREQDIQDIVETLSQRCPTYKGISSCGQGGMGKTSLAREVCFKMKYSKDHWRANKIELRETKSLKEMLRATMLKLGQTVTSTSEDELQQQLFGYIKGNCKEKIVLLFDNLDDVMAKEKNNVIRFFKELLGHLNETDNCMIRVIITSREKLISEDELLAYIHQTTPRKEGRLDGLVQEFELKPLKDKESMELFRKCTKGNVVSITGKKASRILQLCGNCPLAIRTVCDTLRYNLISAEDVIKNVRGSTSTDTFGVTSCLQQTFDTLDEIYRNKLMQLKVFKTAGFTLDAAMAILNVREIFTAKTELLYLKSRHLVEIEDLTLLDDENKDAEYQKKGNMQYSIHPLVYRFLSSKEITNMSETFKESVQKAKLNFLEYVESRINDYEKQKFQNYLKAQQILANHEPHILTFYHLMRSYPHEMVTGKPGDKRSDKMLANKRIGDLADVLFDDQEKVDLLNNWIAAAESEGDELEAIFWKIERASKYLDMDRNEHVHAVLDAIEAKLFHIASGKYCEDSVSFVKATFYFLKGRFLFQKRKTDDGLEYLRRAKKLFKEKQMRKFYKDCLVNCYNSMGAAYYKQTPEPDIEKARKFHEKALKKASEMTNDNMNCDIPTYLANVGSCIFREGLKSMSFNQKEEAEKKFAEALEYYSKGIRLDIQMKLHKCDAHAQKLSNRADVYLLMGEYESAKKDMSEAMTLRKEILKPPHLQLTITAHKAGEILRQSSKELYKQNADKAYEMVCEAGERYKEVASMVKEGGITRDHEEYNRIKENHFKTLRELKEHTQLRKYEKFYKDFENGKFEHISRNRRSMKETDGSGLCKHCLEEDMDEASTSSSSSSSSEDEVDDNESSTSQSSDEELKEINSAGSSLELQHSVHPDVALPVQESQNSKAKYHLRSGSKRTRSGSATGSFKMDTNEQKKTHSYQPGSCTLAGLGNETQSSTTTTDLSRNKVKYSQKPNASRKRKFDEAENSSDISKEEKRLRIFDYCEIL